MFRVEYNENPPTDSKVIVGGRTDRHHGDLPFVSEGKWTENAKCPVVCS
jgi:hypothetical protein